MTFSEQLRLLPERPYQGGPTLHGAQVAAGAHGEIPEVAGAVAGHGVMLQITPDAFDGIHLRGVGPQVLQGDVATLRLDVCTHELGAVGRQAIPDDQKFLANRFMQHMRETFGRAAPELLETQYAREIWRLYEAGELRPDFPLTGRFEPDPTAPDVDAVLHQIEDERREAEDRARRRAEAGTL